MSVHEAEMKSFQKNCTFNILIRTVFNSLDSSAIPDLQHFLNSSELMCSSWKGLCFAVIAQKCHLQNPTERNFNFHRLKHQVYCDFLQVKEFSATQELMHFMFPAAATACNKPRDWTVMVQGTVWADEKEHNRINFLNATSVVRNVTVCARLFNRQDIPGKPQSKW